MKKLLTILPLLATLFGYSQVKQVPVTVTTGGTTEVGNYTHSFNIGQLIVSTGVSDSTTATQGFFQPTWILCREHSIISATNTICGSVDPVLRLGSIQNYENYQWFIIEDGDTLKVSDGVEKSYTPNYPGDYFVRYSGLFCVNETDTVTVSLDGAALIPEVTKPGAALTTPEQGVASYQWFVNYNSQKYAIYGQTSSTYTPIFDEIYYVEVTYSSGDCRIMSDGFKVMGLGRRMAPSNISVSNNNAYLSLGEEVSINLYPYPTYESFTLDMLSDYTGYMDVTMFNAEGKPVNQQRVEKTSAMFSREVSTIGLSEGLYTVMIQTATDVYSEKMLILE